jgi:hypothetical protein
LLTENTIRSDWKDNPIVGEFSLSIFLYVSEEKNHFNFYTFSGLKEALNIENNEFLAQALNYLCSPKSQVLSQIFFYIDDQDNEYQFDNEEINHYIQDGFFASPHTGQQLNSEDIYIAYQLGRCFKEDASND